MVSFYQPTANMKISSHIQSSNNKTILITGGCGFIGANTVKHLITYGYKIRVLDNLSAGNKENLVSTGCNLVATDLIIGDIRDKDTVNKAVENTDAVIHLAAQTNVVESLTKPQENWDINVTGTLNLLEACRLLGVRTFVLASSNAVLGEQASPVDETKVPKPISPYGASKLACEALSTAYYHSFGLNTISLRFANCYGPYSKHKKSVIAKFISGVRQQKPLIIYGDGKQTRDFIHADDICQAIHICLTTPKSISGEIFQIASGKETSINEIASMMKDIANNDVKLLYKPRRKGEIERNYSNITKAKKMLGFDPKVELRNGLYDLWKWYEGVAE